MYETKNEDVPDFLAHHGVKGMKWGKRRTPAQLARAAGESASSAGTKVKEAVANRPKMSDETKRKLAIGAGIVGAAAVVAVGAYAANKHLDANKLKTLGEMRKQVETRRAGEAAARAQLQSYKGQAKWKLSTHSKANREGKKAAASEVAKIEALKADRHKAFAQRTAANRAAKDERQRRLNTLTSSGRAKNRTETARKQIDQFAKKSMWELANELPAKPSKKTVSYSPKDSKKDAKLYGDAGAARIRKNVEKGMLLSEARQKEAMKAYGGTALKVALNMRSAQKRESKMFDQLRRG